MTDNGWSTSRRPDVVPGGTVFRPEPGDREQPPAPRAAAPGGRGPVRASRRTRFTLSRLDPWTTLKVSFVYGLAGLIVLLVAVTLLYGLVDAMGVLTSLRRFLDQIGSSQNGSGGLTAWLGFERIFLATLVLGVVNVVLFSALATMGAFIYNVSSEIVGGLELTLTERG